MLQSLKELVIGWNIKFAPAKAPSLFQNYANILEALENLTVLDLPILTKIANYEVFFEALQSSKLSFLKLKIQVDEGCKVVVLVNFLYRKESPKTLETLEIEFRMSISATKKENLMKIIQDFLPQKLSSHLTITNII